VTAARDALDGAVTALAAAGCDTPRLDAEVLLAHALGCSRGRLHSHPETDVSGDAGRLFRELVRRRAGAREPIAYITGRRAFRHLELIADPRALIPRPETELLVELAAAHARGRVLDVCTGSGAVALALAQERPDLEVHGSDLSAAALELARENAARLGLAVTFHQADLLDGLPGPWDAIVANPPYVATGELAALQPEITRHEPRAALDGGEDGLHVIRRLAAQSAAPLLIVELGAGQADGAERLLRVAGYAHVERHRDLAGFERALLALRQRL
jgi:release factor glutamine methyltransferase